MTKSTEIASILSFWEMEVVRKALPALFQISELAQEATSVD